MKDMQETLIYIVYTQDATFFYSLHVISSCVWKSCAFNIDFVGKNERVTSGAGFG